MFDDTREYMNLMSLARFGCHGLEFAYFWISSAARKVCILYLLTAIVSGTSNCSSSSPPHPSDPSAQLYPVVLQLFTQRNGDGITFRWLAAVDRAGVLLLKFTHRSDGPLLAVGLSAKPDRVWDSKQPILSSEDSILYGCVIRYYTPKNQWFFILFPLCNRDWGGYIHHWQTQTLRWLENSKQLQTAPHRS